MLKISARCFEARPESTQENSSIAARIVAATGLAKLRFSAVLARHPSRATTMAVSPRSASKPPREPESNDAATATVAITASDTRAATRSEEHTSELQSHSDLVCRLLLEKKKKKTNNN